MHPTTRMITTGLAGALAAVTIAVAPAGAATDLRTEASIAAASPALDLRTPDAVAAAEAVQAHVVSDVRSPDARDTTRADLAFVPQPSAEPGGVDWGDAGLGAGAALALMLLVAAGTILVIRHRHAIGDSRRSVVPG